MLPCKEKKYGARFFFLQRHCRWITMFLENYSDTQVDSCTSWAARSFSAFRYAAKTLRFLTDKAILRSRYWPSNIRGDVAN